MSADLRLTKHLTNQQAAMILPLMAEILGRELAPRSLAQLQAKLKRQEIIFAFANQQLVGWVLIYSYHQNCQEIGGLYVLPECRRRSYGRQLVQAATQNGKQTLAVTFSQANSYPFFQALNFQRLTLKQILARAGWGFIKARLSPARLKSIFSHRRGGEIIYLTYLHHV